MHSLLYCAVPVRCRGDRRQPAGHGAPARVQGRARCPERRLSRGRHGPRGDRRGRHHLHGAGRPGRLHAVARRAVRRDRPDAGGVPGDPRAAPDERQAELDHPPLAATHGRAARPTSTRPGTSATGRRRSTASSSGWRSCRSSSARPSEGAAMQTNLRGRDLISLQEWTREEIDTVLDVALVSEDAARPRAADTRCCATRSWRCCSSSRARGPVPRSRPGWRNWVATRSSSSRGRPRSPTATPPARSARSSAATTTGSPSATSTGASATSTSARSPRRAACPSSTCSATCITRTRSSPTC